jgi:hypothetical protein
MKRTTGEILLDSSLYHLAQAFGPISSTHALIRSKRAKGVSLRKLQSVAVSIFKLDEEISEMRRRIRPAGGRK